MKWITRERAKVDRVPARAHQPLLDPNPEFIYVRLTGCWPSRGARSDSV